MEAWNRPLTRLRSPSAVTSRCSAAPATSPCASCSRRSTTATARASCPTGTGSSASPAATSTTTATAPSWPRPSRPTSPPPTSTRSPCTACWPGCTTSALDVAAPDDWHVLHGRAQGPTRPATRPSGSSTSPSRRPCSVPICGRLDEIGVVNEHARVVMEKPVGHDLASAREVNDAVGRVFDESRRSSGSTTTSARRASRTSWSPGSPTRSSSRCGTPAGSTTSRSPSPRRSASPTGSATTTSPARCATWCRTTCSSCSAWWRWSRRPTSAGRPSATRSSRCSRRCKPMTPTDVDRDIVRGRYTQGLVDGAAVPAYDEELGATGGLGHRDLRRAADRGAELALGRRAVLPAHRQADGPALVGDRGGVQGAAARDVPARRGSDHAEPAAHPGPARRRACGCT